MSFFIIFNGEIIPTTQQCIRYNDRGFTLGHGLFETILINKQEISLLDYHWKRLQTSANLIGIKPPFSCAELKSMINKLNIANNLQDITASVRVTISDGESARGIVSPIPTTPNFIISIVEYHKPQKKSFSAIVVNNIKNEHSLSSQIKSISYLDNIIAKKEAIEKSYDEAILLNTAGKIADGSISNIFIIKNNCIYTPPIKDGALPGVIRTVLLEEFNGTFNIQEKSFTVSEAENADEVFLTNALMGIQPVHLLNFSEYKNFSISNKIANTLKQEKNYI